MLLSLGFPKLFTAKGRFADSAWNNNFKRCTETPKLVYSFYTTYNIIYLFTAIGLLPGGSGYFTCKQNMKFVTAKFKSGGLHEKHVVATWNVGNHLSICL